VLLELRFGGRSCNTHTVPTRTIWSDMHNRSSIVARRLHCKLECDARGDYAKA